MSISSELTKLNTNMQNAYAAVSNKGGTLPSSQNMDNLATAIDSISGGGTPVINTLNVTPKTSAQTIVAPSGVDGYSPVNVSAVTSAIDANISAGNIKSGVSILGVSGSVTELKGETRSVSLTSSSGNTFTPTSGKNGITSIKVTPNNQARSVTPSKSAQTLNVNSGYSGNGTISVSAVTSSIDSNITAGNIKKNVQILGVTGTYEGSGGGGGLIMTDNFYFTHDTKFNLESVTKTVGYAVGNGNIPIALLYDSNGDLIYKSPNNQYLAIDFENLEVDMDENEALIKIFDIDSYPTRFSQLHISLS